MTLQLMKQPYLWDNLLINQGLDRILRRFADLEKPFL